MMREFTHFILDQLGNPPYISVRKLFGEDCLFYHGKIVAIISNNDRLFIKANADTLPYFLAEHSEQFSYATKKGISKMHYWSVPDGAIEEPDELKKWLDLGIKAMN